MKDQYIKQVGKALAVSHKRQKDILRDLEEAFASAKEHGETEEQVIERLGTPEEFAASMSESTVVKKRMKPKTITLCAVCVVVVMVIISTLSALYMPVIFHRGNPIPYLKAAKLLTEENHFAVVEDKNADGMVLISDEPECHDVLEFIYQRFGLPHSIEFLIAPNGIVRYYHENQVYFGGDATYNVTLDTFMDKYTVWDIPADFLDLPPNHELLDNPNDLGRMGYLYTKKRSNIIELLGEPEEITEQGDLYYNCFGKKIVIRYDAKDNVVLIKKDNSVVYSKLH